VKFSFTHQNSIKNKTWNDKTIILYNWKNKNIIRVRVLPATDRYRRFGLILGNTTTVDSNNRVYFYFGGFYEDEETRAREHNLNPGHIMIYDPEKDYLYNIYNPYTAPENVTEPVLGYQYLIGEDENIYYQEVRESGHYIYKITPLWDEPMEETEYNPIFFEFQPELKAEWDRMTAEEEEKAANQ